MADPSLFKREAQDDRSHYKAIQHALTVMSGTIMVYIYMDCRVHTQKINTDLDRNNNLAKTRVNLRLYTKWTKEMYPKTLRALFIMILVCFQLYGSTQ